MTREKARGVARLSRRQLIKWLGGAAVSLVPFARRASGRVLPAPGPQTGTGAPVAASSPLSEADEALVDEIERRNFAYFWEHADLGTGIVRDRLNVRKPDKSPVGSIAATGFGLTALCIGDARAWVPHEDARDRARTALQFLANQMPNHRGFFFHWANVTTGERLWDSEISSVDTSILLCGVLTCAAHFGDGDISRLAKQIFDRVDWSWLSEDTSLLPHGWRPETGFLQYRWDNYSEMMMIYLLGLGSSAYPLPPEAWNAWQRTLFEYDGIRYVGSFAPLFIHQYSQAWFDFRNRRDRYADYFQNSILATEAHRRFCLDLARRFPDYSDDLWGITASDSPRGYAAWGGPPQTGPIDGTVVPSAAGGSLPFLPGPALRVLRTMKDRYGARAWCDYGFVDAFNPLTGWYDTDVVGIDVGITLVMAENLRTGFVWNTFMKNAEARRGMARAGFKVYRRGPYR